MANTPEIVGIALRVKPDVVCVVPERREELTTEGGMDVVQYLESLSETRKRLNDAGIEVSLFVTPDLRQIEASAKTGSQFVELHTGAMAEAIQRGDGLESEIERLVEASNAAVQSGLRVNAGHGLNNRNLKQLYAVPHLEELNIGHSLVSRAILVGLTTAVQEMLELMNGYPG
jgi:pyridoxine 5-phosphate synthase